MTSFYTIGDRDKAITAIKEALAQPTSGDYALGYSVGFGEGHSAGKALTQPEQEPCGGCGGCGGSGWVPRDPDIGTDQECFVCGGSGAKPEQKPDDLTIAYMAGFSRGKDLAPQRKPLTDEERLTIRTKWMGGNWTCGDIIDAVEAAHNIKE